VLVVLEIPSWTDRQTYSSQYFAAAAADEVKIKVVSSDTNIRMLERALRLLDG